MTYTAFAALSVVAFLLPLAFSLGCHRVEALPGEGALPGEPAAKADKTPAHARGANRLAGETSLYLLMHANNPVDWYPWGEEALARAKAENKLIFLSIGYSSCYWCHVMERESFMDDEVAAMLNEHFVCIKVDREERPDVDKIYMTSLQVYFQLIRSAQGGGWPLTMILTPDARPVMGGTYFPPRDKQGMQGLLKTLRLVREAWQEKPQQLEENAGLLADLVKRQLQEPPAKPGARLEAGLVDDALAALAEQFDPEHGGFGYNRFNARMPKFPQPSNLMFLLERMRSKENSDQQAEKMLTLTLEKMAAGGIRDHVGGGFHRYSTDRFWQIPHFEKMLYDNAQLASVYAEAHELTGREDFRHVAEEILEFVLREMTGSEGGFYAAIDAETDAEEGRYYVWEREELAQILGREQFDLLVDVYGIGLRGNFEGRYALALQEPLEQIARTRRIDQQELRRELPAIHQKLLLARSRRERPATDTKVLTAWNGLMIRGFADAGRLLDNRRYVEAAEKAADFALDKLRTPKGRLLRTYGAGKAKLNAYLDDYAFLVDALIALHKATGQRRWLDEADRLTAKQINLFWDKRHGGFFFTSRDHESLLARSKDPTDSALPSGNAVAAGNLVYLAGQLDKPEYLDRAEKTIKAFAPLLDNSPEHMPRMLLSLAALLQARK